MPSSLEITRIRLREVAAGPLGEGSGGGSRIMAAISWSSLCSMRSRRASIVVYEGGGKENTK